MASYILRRLLMLIPVLIGMTIITFSVVHLIPGNPAQVILGEAATQTAIEELEQSLGLDKPVYVQYGAYIMDLLQGDLGTSLRSKTAIAEEIWPYLAATMELTFFAMIFAVFVGVNAGIISAWKQNSWFDFLAMIIALIGVSIPVFWLALMEQWVFAQELGWLSAHGRQDSRNPMDSMTYFYIIDTLIHLVLKGMLTALKQLVLS